MRPPGKLTCFLLIPSLFRTAMTTTPSFENQGTQTTSVKPAPKKGVFFGMVTLICVIFVMGTVSVFAYFGLFASGSSTPGDLIFETVKRGVFLHEVTDRGNVESAQNEDIRCQVESQAGILIVWIIPEGTAVEEGEVLVRLDSSNLEERVANQEVSVANSEASLEQAKADLAVAELARDEYLPRDPEQQGLKGVFHKEQKAIENKILKAEEDLSRATETRGYTEKLLAQGYVTDLQLKADKAKEEQLQNDLESAQLELEVLQKYTSKKMLEQLNADIKTATVTNGSATRRFQIETQRLSYLRTQVENCTIKAPKAGQVVYASPSGPWRRDNEIIKEGNSARDRQTLIRLPDPNQMQVAGMVNEASVSLVKVGQPAAITLEAMPSHVFNGTVKQVNDYPEPDGFMGSMAKEYKAIITMDDLDSLPPGLRSGIRPGLTAKIVIDVTDPNIEEMPLLVAVQTLFEHMGKYYCITCEDGKWEKVEVTVGPTNDKEVVIKSGLTEGMRVVHGAWKYAKNVLTEEELTTAREFGAGGARQRRGPGRPGGPGGPDRLDGSDSTGRPDGPGESRGADGAGRENDFGSSPGFDNNSRTDRLEANNPNSNTSGQDATPGGNRDFVPGMDRPQGERPSGERPNLENPGFERPNNLERPGNLNPPLSQPQQPPVS